MEGLLLTGTAFWKGRSELLQDRCSEMQRRINTLEKQVSKWRNAAKKHRETINHLYQEWEESDKILIEKIDRIANPIKTFEESQQAAKEALQYLHRFEEKNKAP